MFRDDGHVSVRGWVKASIRVADVAVTHRVRTAKLVHDLPQCADALAAGRLGVDQVRELARLHANPRCGDQLAASVDGLIDVATTHTFEVFRGVPASGSSSLMPMAPTATTTTPMLPARREPSPLVTRCTSKDASAPPKAPPSPKC